MSGDQIRSLDGLGDWRSMYDATETSSLNSRHLVPKRDVAYTKSPFAYLFEPVA